MSRIGIQPIAIPDAVSISTEKGEVIVKGEKGEIRVTIPSVLRITDAEKIVTVARTEETITARALHGTIRAILQNAVSGVSVGWKRQLDLIGSGYRVAVNGDDLELHIGFSHTVHMAVPAGLEAKVVKNSITISGVDRQAVGQFAATVRSLRKPEPYKGKGIRFHDEHVRRKVGKALKSGE